MKIQIFGKEENTALLLNKVKSSLDELGLVDFIKIEITNKAELKKELNIQKEPALIVVEDAIDFKDIIFEGIVPEDEELKSMFISIIGGGDIGDGCTPTDCGSCSQGC